MKQFWTPQIIYDFLKNHHRENELLSRELPQAVYCTENLLWAELLTNQKELPSLQILENLFGVANRLQSFRDTVFKGAQIIITSGWRSSTYNKSIGGEPMSKHISGQAIDFFVMTFAPSKVQTLLKSHSGGLGAYKSFTHIDISTKRRWQGQD